MGKFNKTGKRGMPALNTSSLPDLIFTLLFFFMIVTTMREVTLKVEFKVPQATELEKLEKKSLVTFIYVGKPTAEFRKKLGNESRIQLNDSYAEVAEIQDYIIGERASMKEEDQPQMTVSLKVDQDTKMGIVTDIKEALRKAYALKINYSAPDRFVERAIGADIILKLDKDHELGNKVATINLHIPGDDLVAESRGKSFEEAVDLSIEALKRQIDKYKGRLEK